MFTGRIEVNDKKKKKNWIDNIPYKWENEYRE